MVEVVSAWSLCCVLQAFHYRPCLSSHWYASSTVVIVTPTIVAAVTASVPDVDPAVHAMLGFKCLLHDCHADLHSESRAGAQNEDAASAASDARDNRARGAAKLS